MQFSDAHARRALYDELALVDSYQAYTMLALNDNRLTWMRTVLTFGLTAKLYFVRRRCLSLFLLCIWYDILKWWSNKGKNDRYNLKRKIAGLPPVTKDWFDSRKELLSNSASSIQAQKIWTDPLTKKRFQSENTYTAFVNSKKYQDAVKKSGQPAPKPFVSIKRNDAPGMLLVHLEC